MKPQLIMANPQPREKLIKKVIVDQKLKYLMSL
jgi:hypothetical protein